MLETMSAREGVAVGMGLGVTVDSGVGVSIDKGVGVGWYVAGRTDVGSGTVGIPSLGEAVQTVIPFADASTVFGVWVQARPSAASSTTADRLQCPIGLLWTEYVNCAALTYAHIHKSCGQIYNSSAYVERLVKE